MQTKPLISFFLVCISIFRTLSHWCTQVLMLFKKIKNRQSFFYRHITFYLALTKAKLFQVFITNNLFIQYLK